MINQCAVCGKFCRWDDLVLQFSPDTVFNGEDGYNECKKCIQKTIDRNNNPTFKLLDKVESDMFTSTTQSNKMVGLSEQLEDYESLSPFIKAWRSLFARHKGDIKTAIAKNIDLIKELCGKR